MQVAVIFIRHPITIPAITTHLTTTAARVFTGAIATITTDPVITTVAAIADTVNQLTKTAARPAYGRAASFG